MTWIDVFDGGKSIWESATRDYNEAKSVGLGDHSNAIGLRSKFTMYPLKSFEHKDLVDSLKRALSTREDIEKYQWELEIDKERELEINQQLIDDYTNQLKLHNDAVIRESNKRIISQHEGGKP